MQDTTLTIQHSELGVCHEVPVKDLARSTPAMLLGHLQRQGALPADDPSRPYLMLAEGRTLVPTQPFESQGVTDRSVITLVTRGTGAGDEAPHPPATIIDRPVSPIPVPTARPLAVVPPAVGQHAVARPSDVQGATLTIQHAELGVCHEVPVKDLSRATPAMLVTYLQRQGALPAEDPGRPYAMLADGRTLVPTQPFESQGVADRAVVTVFTRGIGAARAPENRDEQIASRRDDEELFGAATQTTARPRFAALDNPRYVALELDGAVAFLRVSALCEMFAAAHARTVEVGFLCMGRRERDPKGTYTVVEELPIVGVGTRAHVEMPATEKLEAQRRHAALDVVGWSHTHPGHGVFFSGTDVANCRHYGPEAINLVYDPEQDQLGVAVGAEMRLRIRGRELLGGSVERRDEATVLPATVAAPPRPEPSVYAPRSEGPARRSSLGWLILGAIVGWAADHFESAAVADPAPSASQGAPQAAAIDVGDEAGSALICPIDEPSASAPPLE